MLNKTLLKDNKTMVFYNSSSWCCHVYIGEVLGGLLDWGGGDEFSLLGYTVCQIAVSVKMLQILPWL